MQNQHAGLSHLLATQRITERQDQAAETRLAHSAGRPRRRRRQWTARRWWRLAGIGATLTATSLVAMTAVALAQAPEQPAGQQATRRSPSERQVGESWRHRQAAAQDRAAADATLGRVQARERFSIPSATPADVPAPVPSRPSRQPGWRIIWLSGLVAALVLAGGLAVLATRRTRHRARPGHAT
jgi:hypothetical protein